MGENSGISWTNDTFNVWWGCTKVSEGCENCYAEELAVTRRKLPIWGPRAERRFFGETHWREPEKWNRLAEKAGVPRRVFCSSMADVFEQHADPAIALRLAEHRARLWSLIDRTPWLDWLLLTKRPQNIRAMLPPGWLSRPRHNVWLGTTAESQKRWDERVPLLLEVPALHHFVSVEPQIERVRMGGFRPAWVICGGESGRSARPFDLGWARDLRDEAAANGVTRFFMKQTGSEPVADRRIAPPHHGLELALVRDMPGKGHNPAFWPEDLRVQLFPRTATRLAMPGVIA